MKKGRRMAGIIIGAVVVIMLVAGVIVYWNIGDKTGYRNERDISGQCGDNLTYEYVSKTGILTIKGFGDMTSCPWSGYDGVTVKSVEFEEGITSIFNGAFYNQKELSGDIILPSTLTYIDDFSFYGTKSLGNVTFSSETTYLGDYAFSGSGIKGELNLPDSITYIGVECFNSCENLTGTLKLPASLEKIGRVAFKKCSGFTGSLVIPDSVTEIGDYAFSECTGFTGTLTLSNNLKLIDENCFAYCGFKGDLIIPEGVTTVEQKAFLGCGFDGNILLPSTLTEIRYGAFEKNPFRGELVIPSGIEIIDSNAFYDCGGLTFVVFNEGLRYICSEAFENCVGLKELNLPDGLIGIGGAAFRNCIGLSGSLILPDSVEIIEEGAFSNCSGFTGNLVIPKGVSEINDKAFNTCSGFSGTLVIPEGTYYIGTRAFQGCSGITKVIVGKDVMAIGGAAFEDCKSLKEIEFTNAQWIPDYYTEKVSYNNTFTFPDGCNIIKPSSVVPILTYWDAVQENVKKEKNSDSTQSSNNDGESNIEPYYWTDAIKNEDFRGTEYTADTEIRLEDGEIVIRFNGREINRYDYQADRNSDDQSIVTDRMWYKDGYLSDLHYYRGYNCEILKGTMTHLDGKSEDVYFYKNVSGLHGSVLLNISIEKEMLK